MHTLTHFVYSYCFFCSFACEQVGLILGGELYFADFAYNIEANPALFQENVQKLADRVRTICNKL